ncbi:MAG: GNAT family N-acetyltransferase [Muribaculaceae bacterium]|nr:GNAT family N-acetyltransferase [Muribaculaceae bacterium]
MESNEIKIRLRAPEPADIDTLYIWENDPELWPCGDNMAPLSRHALARYIDNYSGDIATDGQLRLIITEPDGTAVGVVDLYEYSQRDRRAGVGIFIQKEYRCRGYAFQALAWLGVYCATHLGLHQLWAVVGADNDASRALFHSAGFKTCGRLRSWLRRGRRFGDAIIYQRLFE